MQPHRLPLRSLFFKQLPATTDHCYLRSNCSTTKSTRQSNSGGSQSKDLENQLLKALQPPADWSHLLYSSAATQRQHGPIQSPNRSVNKPAKYPILTLHQATQSQPVETATRTLKLIERINNPLLIASPNQHTNKSSTPTKKRMQYSYSLSRSTKHSLLNQQYMDETC